MKYPISQIVAGIALSGLVGSAHAELVDFTGLSAGGGTFDTGVDGHTINQVTVSPITNVDAAGSTLESYYGGPGLRQVTQNAGGGYDTGDQSMVTLTLDQAEVFTLSTGSGPSAADHRDIIYISPVGISLPPGGSNFWNVSGTSNVNVFENAYHVLVLTGTGADGVFMTYGIQPSQPLASFTVTHESTVAGSTLNSHVFDLDVSVAAASAAVPTLSQWGVVGLSLILGLFGLFGIRRRSGPEH